jgi:uncharacterized protein (DUF433 family)
MVKSRNHKRSVALYGDLDPSDVPLYGSRDASRYLKIAHATLRSWFAGTNRGQFQRVLTPAATGPIRLSFNNLAEAYVLWSLRTVHEVRLSTIRQAIAEAEQELGISHLLRRRDLKAHAGTLLIGKFDQYLRLGASGQFAMKRMLDAALRRFEWEDPEFPSKLFPVFSNGLELPDKVIVINPRRSFGSPILVSKGISTSVITMRYNARESIKAIAKDYDVSEEEITAAIVYEAEAA